MYPVLAALPCSECQAYVINYNWETHRAINDRLPIGARDKIPCGDDFVRLPGNRPPCMDREGNEVHGRCPKGHPSKERYYQLSEKNRQTVQLYLQIQATAGACVTPAMRADKLLMRNLAICHSVVERYKRHQEAEQTGDAVSAAVARLLTAIYAR